MFKRQIKSKAARFIFVLLACIGATHFAFSIFLWIMELGVGLKVGGLDWGYYFRHSASAFLLFALFVTASVFAWRSRLIAVPLTVLSLLAAVCCFFYDASHHYYQLQTNDGSGCKHAYLTWIWYDDGRNPNR